MTHKYHYVYEVINMENGKIYVGVHSTNNKYDDYIGSGSQITKAIKKYGKHNFIKYIIFDAETREAAFAYEKQIVTKEFVESPETYNVVCGGGNPAPKPSNLTSEERSIKSSIATKAAMARPEVKLANSLAQKKRFSNPIERQKNAERVKLRNLDPEVKLRHSVAASARWANPEYRAKMSKIRTGRVVSEEQKAKQRVITTELWKDPIYLEKMKNRGKKGKKL